MSGTTKTIIILFFALTSSFFFAQTVYQQDQLNQARTIANMVEHIGQWASQYRGVWIKEAKGDAVDLGSHLDTLTVSLANEDNSITSSEDLATTLNFHLKNPALVQREISDLMSAKTENSSYRITSDKYMNPKNSPTAFESSAIKYMRQNNVTEYSVARNGETLYARALIATEACMRCHDAPEKAPNAVRNQYPTQGYGYELGKVAGVISVRVPSKFSLSTLGEIFNLASILAFLTLAGATFALSRKK